ncbi:MAG: hypothetical protein V3V30_08350 [Parvularculaceae bacterium]
MNDDIPIIETAESQSATPAQQYDDFIGVWISYSRAKQDFQMYVGNRLEWEQSHDLQGPALASWLGTEQEMADAIAIHKASMIERLEEMEQIPEEYALFLSAQQRLEIKRIKIILERESELEKTISSINREVPHEREE